MSKRSYFSQYESPNIVIVPTFSFCNGSPRKKMKKTQCHANGAISKDSRESKAVIASSINVDDTRISVGKTKTNNSDKNVSRNKHSSHIGRKKPVIKLNRLKRDQKPKEDVSTVNETKKISTCTEIKNKQVNKCETIDSAKSSVNIKKDIEPKQPNSITNITKDKLSETICKTSRDLVCNTTTDGDNNSDRASLKYTDNQNTSSTSNDKLHSKQNHRNKYRIPKSVTTSHCHNSSKNTVLKMRKYKELFTEVVKYDKRNKVSSIKQSDQSKKKDQSFNNSSDDNTDHKKESENIHHKNKRLKHHNKKRSDEHIRELLDTSKDCKINKCKHRSHKQNTEKDKNISRSKSKTLCHKKEDLTDQKKCNIEKQGSKNKCTNSGSVKKSQSKERDKNKKVESSNKSEHKDKKHKLKSPKIDKTEEPSFEQIPNGTSRISSNNVCKNLTVTVETQSEQHTELETNKLSNSQETGGIKLIINFVVKNGDSIQNIKTQEISYSREENLKSPSAASSELSFLDDINIDEIVDSLRQTKLEKDTKQQDLRNPLENLQEPIVMIDDDSDIEENIMKKKMIGLNRSETPVNYEKYKSSDGSPISIQNNNLINGPHIKINSIHQSTHISVVKKTTLVDENITKQEAAIEYDTIALIDITQDEGMIEALSDCSTIVLDELDRSDIEECDDVPDTKYRESIPEVIESSTYQENMEDTVHEIDHLNQLEKIILFRVSHDTTPKDPIELQLNKMFEMGISDTSNNYVHKSVRLGSANKKEIENMREQNHHLPPNHNEDQGFVGIEQNKSQEMINNGDQILPSNPTNKEKVVSVNINPDTELVENNQIFGDTKRDECQETTDKDTQCSPVTETNNVINASVNINPEAEIIENNQGFEVPEKDESEKTTNSKAHSPPANYTNNVINESVNINQNTEIIENNHVFEELEKIKSEFTSNNDGQCLSINEESNIKDAFDNINPNTEIIENRQDLIEAEKNKSPESSNKDGRCSLLNKTNDIKDASLNINQKTEVKNKHNKDESQETTNKDEKCAPVNKTNNVKNTSIDTEVVKNTKPLKTTEVTTPVQTVESQIRIVNENQPFHTQENNKFIQALERKMMTSLKIKFTVKSLIHRGKHSKIYKGADVGGLNYALKILNNTRDRYHMGVHKETMLRNIQIEIPKERLHNVYVIDGFSTAGYWCFLMEYYPKTLSQVLQENNKSFHINDVQHLSKQLVLAVTVLRNHNIVHSDIKPSHILINTKCDRIKLCGFDTAFYVNNNALASNVGTANYRPPEVILGYSSGFSLDVWSSALVMYEMATGTKLFPGTHNNDILYKQQCTLGAVPYDMVHSSMFKDNHFYNNCFMRKIGFNKEVIKFVYSFEKNKRIHKTIFDAYTQDWCDDRTQPQRAEDLVKLADFRNLLEQMLAIHPKYRLSIDFVYANPFIYEYSDMPYL